MLKFIPTPFFPCAVLITKIILITFLSNKIDNVSQHCHSLCGVLLSHTSVRNDLTTKVWQGSNLRLSNKFDTLPSELHTLIVRKRIFFMKHQLSPNTCGKPLILYKQVFFFRLYEHSQVHTFKWLYTHSTPPI